MKASDFNKYAKELTDVRIENECPLCGKNINGSTDIRWIDGNNPNNFTCVHLNCGCIFGFDPVDEVYHPIGRSQAEQQFRTF